MCAWLMKTYYDDDVNDHDAWIPGDRAAYLWPPSSKREQEGDNWQASPNAMVADVPYELNFKRWEVDELKEHLGILSRDSNANSASAIWDLPEIQELGRDMGAMELPKTVETEMRTAGSPKILRNLLSREFAQRLDVDLEPVSDLQKSRGKHYCDSKEPKWAKDERILLTACRLRPQVKESRRIANGWYGSTAVASSDASNLRSATALIDDEHVVTAQEWDLAFPPATPCEVLQTMGDLEGLHDFIDNDLPDDVLEEMFSSGDENHRTGKLQVGRLSTRSRRASYPISTIRPVSSGRFDASVCFPEPPVLASPRMRHEGHFRMIAQLQSSLEPPKPPAFQEYVEGHPVMTFSEIGDVFDRVSHVGHLSTIPKAQLVPKPEPPDSPNCQVEPVSLMTSSENAAGSIQKLRRQRFSEII